MTDNPAFWKGEVYISGDHAWGTDDDLETVYLGKASEVLPILDGAPMPEEFKGARRRILEGILEEKELGRTEESTGTSNLPRASRGRLVRGRQKSLSVSASK